MKRIFNLLAIIFMTASALMAQDKKSFTLEDLLPGGKNYSKLQPKNLTWYPWWGDLMLKEENEDKTEEEKKEAEEKFAADTAAGINSALNIVGSASSGTTMEKEDLKNDFANVLESDVCVDSLNEITEDEEVKEKVQNVTANMDEETKNELKQQVQDKINENPEKEEDYKKLAESLGIPLDMIPEGGIPEGALPEGWPQQ